jgi:osmoprotectant transport system permease protein
MNLLHFFAENRQQISELTLEHLWLVGISTLLAVLVGIPLGIMSARWPAWNKPVLGTANVIQTIPSLALFGFLLPVPWLGDRADRLAILALTLYALLPIIRNTYVGIRGVDPSVIEAGRGMGLSANQLLFQVELPLASSVIVSGVRIAVVISVGLATIAAAIGAGGLGEFIFRGLAMVNNQLILAGAIPAAGLALSACARDENSSAHPHLANFLSQSSAALLAGPLESTAFRWSGLFLPGSSAVLLRAVAFRSHRDRLQELHRVPHAR